MLTDDVCALIAKAVREANKIDRFGWIDDDRAVALAQFIVHIMNASKHC